MAQNTIQHLPGYAVNLIKSAGVTNTIVLVLDQANTLSFAAAVDPMRAANRQANRALFAWQFATPTNKDVTLTSGLVVPAAPLRQSQLCDFLIVVAGFDLDVQTTPEFCASLRRLASGARIVAGIDGGSWVMARAGLLDGEQATTHWEDLEDFADQFPNVTVRDARFVTSGTRLTSGGAIPAIDMMLHVIATHYGDALADRVAGSFIYDTSPASVRPQDRHPARARHSPGTRKAHNLMQAHLEDPLPITDIARQLGLSLRGLQMQFQSRLETSPQAYYLMLRLTEAERLVTQSDLSLQDVGLRTGFASQSSFARAFRHRFGTSARARRTADAAVSRALDADGAPS